MRLDCPACAASYNLPDHLVIKGRRTRCARCGKDWVPIAADPMAIDADEAAMTTRAGRGYGVDGDEDASFDASDPARSARDRAGLDDPAAAAHEAHAPPALKMAWGASILAILLMVVGLIVWRDSVVRHWPASAWVLGSPAPRSQ